VVLDMDRQVTVNPAVLNSFSDYTPHEGMIFTGWPRTTVVGGEVMYHRGEINDTTGHRGRVLRQADQRVS
jgi:dihydroorotase-like cyclic amidohydrolase